MYNARLESLKTEFQRRNSFSKLCALKKKIKLSLDKVEKLFHVSAFLLCHVLSQNWKVTFLKWKLVLVLQETEILVHSNV